jgi:putative transposase
MAPLSYRHPRFPPAVIQHAVLLYLRSTLSIGTSRSSWASGGLDLFYETVRRWVLKLGPAIARNLRCQRARPSDRWHLDEMVVRLPVGGCTSGAPSTTKVRFSRCWSSAGATSARHCVSS